jgi:GT2 family glycosyltransferase
VVDWVAGSCLRTRRDLFTRLGGLDEAFFLYWEDADYARRAAREGATCQYVPMVTARHAAGRSAAHNPNRFIRVFHQSAYRMYWKHAGPLGRLFAPVAKTMLWLRAGLVIALRRRTP